MRTTGKFDSKGEEIFEGDKVIHGWGVFRWGGEGKSYYQIHTITVRDAHMMGNGEMHDDGGGIIFCLGKSYNFWKGEEVQKLSEKDLAEINMPDDTYFFFDENKKAIRFTDQHFMGLSDEDWQKYLEKRNKYFTDFVANYVSK